MRVPEGTVPCLFCCGYCGCRVIWLLNDPKGWEELYMGGVDTRSGERRLI